MGINLKCPLDGHISLVCGSLEYGSSESFDGIVKECQFQIKEHHKELQIKYEDFVLQNGEIIVRLKNLDTGVDIYIVNLIPGSRSSVSQILAVDPSTSFKLTIEGNNAVNSGIKVSYKAKQVF